MTTDGFSCFLGFQNFGGGPTYPPSRLENMWFIFLNQQGSTQAFCWKWGFQLEGIHHEYFPFWICD